MFDFFFFFFWVHNMQGQNMIFAYKHKRLTVILNQSLSFMTSFSKKLTPVHKSLGKVCYSLLLKRSFGTVCIILMRSIKCELWEGLQPYGISGRGGWKQILPKKNAWHWALVGTDAGMHETTKINWNRVVLSPITKCKGIAVIWPDYFHTWNLYIFCEPIR